MDMDVDMDMDLTPFFITLLDLNSTFGLFCASFGLQHLLL